MSSTKDDLLPYTVVCIRQLLQSPEEYNGWNINQRPPKVGDIGILIDVLTAPNLPDKYVVECSDPDGTDIWHIDFFAEELEIWGKD